MICKVVQPGLSVRRMGRRISVRYEHHKNKIASLIRRETLYQASYRVRHVLRSTTPHRRNSDAELVFRAYDPRVAKKGGRVMSCNVFGGLLATQFGVLRQIAFSWVEEERCRISGRYCVNHRNQTDVTRQGTKIHHLGVTEHHESLRT